MATEQLLAGSAITLRGSTDIVADFFVFGINSILYQRGLYAPETFTRVQKYGLTLLVTTDDELNKYLTNLLADVKEWLLKMTVQKLVIVIRSLDDGEVMERWQFNVECDKAAATENSTKSTTKQKDENEVKKEIQGVIRQITASVTFLPLLEAPCSFDILVYTDKDQEVSNMWNETGPAIIANSQEVKLRSFSTNFHKVDTMVAYRNVTD
jgi:mitotic spindle assembly checkpoint protein MAD2